MSSNEDELIDVAHVASVRMGRFVRIFTRLAMTWRIARGQFSNSFCDGHLVK